MFRKQFEFKLASIARVCREPIMAGVTSETASQPPLPKLPTSPLDEEKCLEPGCAQISDALEAIRQEIANLN